MNRLINAMLFWAVKVATKRDIIFINITKGDGVVKTYSPDKVWSMPDSDNQIDIDIRVK